MNPVVIAVFCVLGLVLLLLAIAAIRAIAIKAKPSTEKSCLSYTEEDAARYAEALSAMVKVPTISLRGQNDLTQFRILQDVMKERFPNIWRTLECTDIDGNLLMHWSGKDSSRAVLLMGHQDVVTADEHGWKHDPFSGDIADGKVHGRGAMDCKCTVLAEWAAVEELIGEGYTPACDVYLACSVNEEISGGGAEKTVEYLKNKGISLSCVMDEGGAIISGAMPGLKGLSAMVGTVEKGYTDVKIYARGAGGHSSTPGRNTALAKLASFVNEVERKRPFKRKLTRPVREMLTAFAPNMSFGFRMLFGNLWLFSPLVTFVLARFSGHGEALVATTACFTMCAGSKTPNVIPDEAWVLCNLRPALHQNSAESVAVIEKYAKKHGLEIEVCDHRDASKCVDTDGEEYRFIKDCLSKCYPQVCVSPYYISGGTDCRNYEAICDNCLRFCPVRMNEQQLSAMHAANENIDVDALAEGVKFYKFFIKNHA